MPYDGIPLALNLNGRLWQVSYSKLGCFVSQSETIENGRHQCVDSRARRITRAARPRLRIEVREPV